jgi:uracil-DNA glycosylase family 4
VIEAEIVECVRCPRLVAWRHEAAAHPPARFAGQKYWERPVPGFGDPKARVLIVGLAPAARGGNRTGRVFTGDRSGDFLFPALFENGFSNQATSTSVDDGLLLQDAFVAAVNRCAPPANKPTPQERDNCLPYLVAEMRALPNLSVIVCLGSYAWDGALRALAALGYLPRPRPGFGHASEARIGPYVLLGSYHPSQQNTFTGKLTPAMLRAVFARAREVAA